MEHLLMMLNILTSLKTLHNTHVRTCLHRAFFLQAPHSDLDLIIPITPHGQITTPAETPWAEFHAVKPKYHLPVPGMRQIAARSTLDAHG